MCWLILVGVSGCRADPVTVIESCGCVAAPSLNPACAAMGPAAAKLAISDGHCACALYLGRQERNPDIARVRARYQRKGWSGTKIERAVQAHSAALEKRARLRSQHNALAKVVSALVESGARVQLLAHFFDSSFDKDFKIVDRKEISLGEFVAGQGAFAEDTLISVMH